jgi:hypothetical protein
MNKQEILLRLAEIIGDMKRDNLEESTALIKVRVLFEDIVDDLPKGGIPTFFTAKNIVNDLHKRVMKAGLL